jgi:hypothetical protein
MVESTIRYSKSGSSDRRRGRLGVALGLRLLAKDRKHQCREFVRYLPGVGDRDRRGVAQDGLSHCSASETRF